MGKLKTYAVPVDVELVEIGPHSHFLTDQQEVVKLVDVEHAIDVLHEERRNMIDELAVIDRLISALPDQTTLSAVLRMVREVEHYRKMRDESPVLSDTSIAIDDHVPTSLKPVGMWKKAGTITIPATGEVVVAITHPGADGLLCVTEDAWECYEDAGRHET